MKKYYIAPETTLVSYAAESVLALSLEVKSGTNGEIAGSNALDFDEEWDEE